jgi:hypothetical protein
MDIRERCKIWVDKDTREIVKVILENFSSRKTNRYDSYLIPRVLGKLILENPYSGSNPITEYRWGMRSNILFDSESLREIRLRDMSYVEKIDSFINGVREFEKRNLGKSVEGPFDQERYDKSAKEIFEEFDKMKV